MKKVFFLITILSCWKSEDDLNREAVKLSNSVNSLKGSPKKSVEKSNNIVNSFLSNLSSQIVKNSSNIDVIKKSLIEKDSESEKNRNRFENILNKMSKVKIGVDLNFRQKGSFIPRDSIIEKDSFFIPTVTFGEASNDFNIKLEELPLNLSLYTNLSLTNNSLALSSLNVILPIDKFRVRIFDDESITLPLSSDFLKTYSRVDIFPKKGFSLIGSKQYYSYSGILKSFFGYEDNRDMFFISFNNKFDLGENTLLYLNANYVEEGNGTERDNLVLKDRKHKGNLSIDFSASSKNKSYDYFLNLNYVSSTGTDVVNSKDDFMKTLTFFKIDEFDAISFYFNTSLFYIKDIRVKGGIFESGKSFYDDFSSKDLDPKSNLDGTNYRAVFKESDVISYKKDGAGMFCALSIGEGTNISQEVSLHSIPKEDDLYKLGIKSKYDLKNMLTNIDLGIYGLSTPFLKLEVKSIFRTKINTKVNLLFTKNSSLDYSSDEDSIIGGSLDMEKSIYSGDILCFKLSSINKGIATNRVNGSISASLEYESPSISNISDFFGSSDFISAGFDYFNKSSIFNFANETLFMHAHLGISTYEMFVNNLLIKANIAAGFNHKGMSLGGILSSKYFISNKSTLIFSVGNMKERDRDYFIDRGYKIKTSIEEDRSRFQIEKDVNFDLKLNISL